MNTFKSTEMFDAFLVFVVIFILIVFLDLLYHQCTTPKTERPIYGQHHSFRFQFKQFIARLLLKLGKHEHMSDIEVDKLRIFSDKDEMPVDAVYFNTSSVNRQIVVFATARRKNGLVNTMGFVKVPEFSNELLVLPVYPGSSLYQNEAEQKNLDSYSVGGIKLSSVIPMKEYRIEYTGKMCFEQIPSKEVNINLDAIWRTNLPAFNFSTDVSKSAMSEAMALEPWTRQYFQNLKSHHQTHFEQYGTLNGVIKIDGKSYPIQTGGLRDRTIGAKRDWNDFHRYVIHYIQLENGNAITVGIISAPVMFTRLLIGFVTNARDKVNRPIDSCSIDLNEFDRYEPPKSYKFDFIADNDSYRVHVERHTQTKLTMGERSECCLTETWCDFKVNGVKGWGAVEWQYRNEVPSTEL